MEGIARRLGETFAVIDLTRPENRKKEYQFTDRDLVLAGAPVYAGRLPRVPEELFTNLRGDHTPCVCMVSYGNRDYDDALLEEKELLESRALPALERRPGLRPIPSQTGSPRGVRTARMKKRWINLPGC